MKIKFMKTVFFAFIIFSYSTLAQSSINLTIDIDNPGIEIPEDYIGFSFGTGTLLKTERGYNFDSANKQMLNIFRELGIKNLRIGGTSVDHGPIPTHEDIDAFFRFVKAADVKVIYSFRLTNGDPLANASIAKYIWDHYKQYLVSFSIGNEPNYIEGRNDSDIKGYPSYLVKWRRFAKVISDSVPGAVFGGPDATTTKRGISWGPSFARDEANSDKVKFIYYHYYVGSDVGRRTAKQVRDEMLSKEWTSFNYPRRFDTTGVPAERYGFPYRLTEANSYCGVPVKGGNNSYATALFTLDFMYWWAWRESLGINFHCTMRKLNSTIYVDSAGNYQVRPMGYGIKAFDLGCHGKLVPVQITDKGLNVTAYATVNPEDLYVTVINKEHGKNARSAEVNFGTNNYLGNAGVMYLTAPGNNVADTTGVTLGGDVITNKRIWNGKWIPLKSKEKSEYKLLVPAASAAVIKISK